MTWKLEHKAGDVYLPDNVPCTHSDTVYSRPGYMAGPGYVTTNAHSVEQRVHHSGSGPRNGETRWPHVVAHISFPAGREDLAEKLSAELRDYIDEFLKAHNLDPKPEEI